MVFIFLKMDHQTITIVAEYLNLIDMMNFKLVSTQWNITADSIIMRKIIQLRGQIEKSIPKIPIAVNEITFAGSFIKKAIEYKSTIGANLLFIYKSDTFPEHLLDFTRSYEHDVGEKKLIGRCFVHCELGYRFYFINWQTKSQKKLVIKLIRQIGGEVVPTLEGHTLLL
jgi:hypothetical protein